MSTNQNNFVIPKKRINNSLLINLQDSSNEVDREVLEKEIKNCYFDKNVVRLGYVHTEMSLVNNGTLDKEYKQSLKEKSKEIRIKKTLNVTKNDLRLTERYFFYAVEDEESMLDIIKNGFVCKESSSDQDNVLGSSQYGIHLSKNFDLTLLYQYYGHVKSFYLIVVKGFYTRFRLTIPNPKQHKDSYPDPIEGVEMSKTIPDNNQPILIRYYNSLIYMFDFDKNDEILNKPKNLLPYAVLKFKLDGNYDSRLTKSGKKFQYAAARPTAKVAPIPNFNNLNISNRNIISVNKLNNNLNSFNATSNVINQQQNQPNRPVINQQQNQKQIQPKFQQQIQKPQEQIKKPESTNQQINKTNQQQQIQLFNQQKSQNQPQISLLPLVEPPLSSSESTENSYEIKIETVQNTPTESQVDNQVESQNDILIEQVKVEESSNKPESSSESEDDSDDAFDIIQYYLDTYSDLVEELYIKPPRWRIIYERTGRLDVKFRGERQMEVKLNKITNTNLKFLDKEKTRVNLNDPTNKLVLTYIEKRPNLKSSSTTNSARKKTTPINLSETRTNVSNKQNTTEHKDLVSSTSNKTFQLPKTDKTKEEILELLEQKWFAHLDKKKKLKESLSNQSNIKTKNVNLSNQNTQSSSRIQISPNSIQNGNNTNRESRSNLVNNLKGMLDDVCKKVDNQNISNPKSDNRYDHNSKRSYSHYKKRDNSYHDKKREHR